MPPERDCPHHPSDVLELFPLLSFSADDTPEIESELVDYQ